jgi:hypothetical protein
MHTVIVIAGGFALLGLCVLVGRWVGGPPPGALPSAALVFIPIWLIAAGINMWVGVSRAGYSIADEGADFRRHLRRAGRARGLSLVDVLPRLTCAIWSILRL